MPVHEVGPDPNGLFYQAVTTQEWQSSYGESLRAQGYRYCGYGTWGIYVAAPGQPCSYRKDVTQPPPTGGDSGGPAIQPPAPPLEGSEGSVPTNGGCTDCGKKEAAPTGVGAAGVSTAAPVVQTGAMLPEKLRGLPWWVFVLIGFTLAHIIGKDRG